MKKLIALLLLLALPVTALAEGSTWTITTQAENDGLTQLIETIFGSDADAVLPFRLLSDTCLTVMTNQDARMLQLEVMGEDFLEGTAYLSSTGLVSLVTPLLPEARLTGLRAPTVSAMASMELGVKRAQNLSWPNTETEGTYLDYTYSGGTRRVTTVFTQAEVRTLLNEMRKAPGFDDAVLSLTGFSTDEMVRLLEMLAADIEVIRHEVYDGQETRLGETWLMKRKGETMLTCSMGLEDGKIKLAVVGIGVADGNLWYSVDIDRHMLLDGLTDEITLVLTQVRDPQRRTYTMAEADRALSRQMGIYQLDIAALPEGTTWTVNAMEIMNNSTVLSFMATVSSVGEMVSAELHLAVDDTEAVHITLSKTEGESIPAMPSGLKAINIQEKLINADYDVNQLLNDAELQPLVLQLLLKTLSLMQS